MTVEQLKRGLGQRDSLVDALVRLWEVERELEQKSGELQRRDEELTRLNREFEVLSHSLSHDLRNPVNNIMALLEVLDESVRQKIDDDEKSYIRHLRESATRLRRLLDGTLRLFHVGKRGMQTRLVDLTLLATGLATEIELTYPQRRYRFEIDEDMVVVGDESLLTQMLQNLLNNAVQYYKPGKSTVIEVGAERPENGRRVFYVRDNGMGFDTKHARGLFAAFERLGKKQGAEGLGAGLAIAQRIVHRHGGEIWAEGKAGKGATFYFRLPVG